jgi:hypothetical protein
MAAAALAAGVLGNTGNTPPAAHHAVLTPPAAHHAVLTPPAASHAVLTPPAQPPGVSPTESPASDNAWSAPLETHHAPVAAGSASIHAMAGASAGTAGSAGTAALAAGGFAAAPLERAIDANPATSPAPAAHPASPGDSHATTGSAATPDPKDLDHLAEEVLNKLRWRLVVERERLMG